MDTKNPNETNGDRVDDAFAPLVCFAATLHGMNTGDATVNASCVGVALRALIEKVVQDINAIFAD